MCISLSQAAGEGINTHNHAATLSLGKPGVLHGSYSYVLTEPNGEIMGTHSISAGWVSWPGLPLEPCCPCYVSSLPSCTRSR